ncbi:MAG TPA: hypothetical protein VGO13_00160 [Solirubrobacterales bacterium]|jgi:hypothetical protein|nr:hypothetical protein [Solirubrobacterales bacterium]
MGDSGDFSSYAASAIARAPGLMSEDPARHDPILEEQVHVLVRLLGGPLSDEELEGFLIIYGRLTDEFGGHRADELTEVFRTSTPEGRSALRQSLLYMNRWVGGYSEYETRYPVTIDPPRPAFPLFKVIGVDRIAPTLYRVFDSRAKAHGAREKVRDLVIRTGRLPAVPRQARPVRRSKPRLHWCSYAAWDSPDATREALQILPEWNSDCSVRAWIAASSVARSTFVAFNGDSDPDHTGPNGKELRFVGYFYEPKAQDHEAMEGGGLQVGVAGAPRIYLLEEWSESGGDWSVVWRDEPFLARLDFAD